MHKDAADAAFHAVAAEGGKGGEGHEVGVPGGAETDGRGEVEGGEEGVVGREGGVITEKLEVCSWNDSGYPGRRWSIFFVLRGIRGVWNGGGAVKLGVIDSNEVE